jgi:hypothetical protein
MGASPRDGDAFDSPTRDASDTPTTVMHLCGVGAGGDHPHLSIDIHAVVAGRLARADVFRHGER